MEFVTFAFTLKEYLQLWLQSNNKFGQSAFFHEHNFGEQQSGDLKWQTVFIIDKSIFPKKSGSKPG